VRRKVAYVAGIILSSMLVITVSCGGDDSVNLIFNQVQGNCAVADQSAATIHCDGGVLTFEGSVVAPNPCYYLKANLDVVDGSNVVIGITAMPASLGEDAYCVECVGGIAFDGTLELSGVCSKIVSIVYNGATIAEYER
jgi:hypothetical protein